MDSGLLSIIMYVGILFTIGVIPVISRLFSERRPSPYGQSWAQVETVRDTIPNHAIPNYKTVQTGTVQTEMDQNFNDLLSSISQQKIDQVPIAADIPFFTADADNLDVKPFSVEPEITVNKFENHSIPDEETMGNIESLIASMNEEEEQPSDYMEDTEVLTALPPNDYFAIAKKFGKGIADMITATPGSFFSADLQQVMMGRIAIQDNEAFLCYREEKALLKGNIPLFDGETLLVKGHFLKSGVFHVLNFEDAETAMHYQEETAAVM